mmetsp:Transcript_13373/g.20184  ORF Transcript_13373/g.20184 Transcript_13373/m.20184 type:complete len:291 (+) Transcript_13373:80-952(+)
MKYFTNEDLNYINSILQKIDVGQSIISGKIEAYNVKTTNETLNKEITEKYSGSPIQNEFQGYTQQQHRIQPQQQKIQTNSMYSSSWSHSQNQYHHQQQQQQEQGPYGSATSIDFSPISPFGPLTQAKSRQTFCNLIEALNQSFPDYDFSNVRPDAFTKETNVQMVMNHVNMTLRDVFNDRDRILLWTILSGIIDMNRCTVFSYNPNDNDPLGCGEGKTWTWNYFFMTKREKKIVLFTCHAQSKEFLEDELMSDSDSEEQNMKNVEYYYPYASQSNQQDADDEELTFENYW